MYLWSAGSWALRNSSRVVCLTNSDAVEVHKLGVHASKIRIIPIAVDPTFFRPRPYKRRGIVWIGRIVPEKGLDSLLQAVVEVRKRMDVHVVIVGDGPLRGKLIQLANRMGISDAVTFVRRASRLDVAKLLAQSLIFVLPSKHEGLPLALLEAMAAGNAIVASELPSVKEALGEAGLYYSGNDPKELAENILLALGDRKMCNRYGREARNIVRNEFSWDIVLPRLDGLYEEVVSCS
jgi:glycosyltransferase involved in cell wall biosynthesis